MYEVKDLSNAMNATEITDKLDLQFPSQPNW